MLVMLILILGLGLQQAKYQQLKQEAIEVELDFQERFDDSHFPGAYASYICFTGKKSFIIECEQ